MCPGTSAGGGKVSEPLSHLWAVCSAENWKYASYTPALQAAREGKSPDITLLPTRHFKGNCQKIWLFTGSGDFNLYEHVVNSRVKYSLPGMLLETLRRSEPGPRQISEKFSNTLATTIAKFTSTCCQIQAAFGQGRILHINHLQL